MPAAPIRVCHVASGDLWAGAEVQLAGVASVLAARADVQLSAILLNEGRLAAELRRLGLPVAVLDERRKSAASILYALVRRLRAHPADVVHTHRYKETVLGGLAARLAGVRAVMRTVHGAREPLRGWQHAKLRAYEALDRLALRCFADRIVAVSAHLAARLRAEGHRPARVVTIHNGVDVRATKPARCREEVRRELGIEPGAPLVGTVGRLTPVKGHAQFLRAARLVRHAHPHARFLLVGDGPLRDALRQQAWQLGLEPACVFAGERADVADLVSALDVFALSSLDEGVPMALLEAMALGRPVVATAVGGVPEVVVDEVSGRLVPPADEMALVRAWQELLGAPERARALGHAARRRVEEAFSVEACGRALAEQYHATARTATAAGVRASARALLARPLGRARAAWSAPERRRLERARADTAALASALRAARRVLVVCHGNIIRSPFAARLLALALGGQERVRVCSAGLAARAGTRSPEEARRAAAAHAVELADHQARPLTPATVASSDVIFVMEVAQLHAMRRRYPEAGRRTFLWASLAPETPLEVRDPFGGDASAFETCFGHISACARPIGRLLAGGVDGR
jgi:glycosyltransferase involved in cell wall biosynthesis/protein-tyrosine-phosphatase